MDPAAPDGMRLAEVPEASATPDQVVVEVHHVSVNRGDLNDARSGRLPVGATLGSDFAGVVLEPAHGSGPAAGTRVVGLAQGAFANRIATSVDALAEIPVGVDPAHATALPVAGLAALQALRACRLTAGQRVLITGASGGVGRFAVQLAAHAETHVIASVGSSARGAGLKRAGAAEIVTGLDQVHEPVDAVLENVGGRQLVEAWKLLAAGGTLQSIGWSSGEPATFDSYSTIGPRKTLSAFLIDGPLAPDLATLARLLADGALRAEIGWRGDWRRIDEAVDALRARHIEGKAVLDITASSV